MKLPKQSKRAKRLGLPLNNWKLLFSSIKDKEHENWVKKQYKLTDPIHLSILVPEKDLDTLGLLFFKIQKDLKMYNQGDVDFYANRKDLPKIRKYLTDYYRGFLKTHLHKEKIK